MKATRNNTSRLSAVLMLLSATVSLLRRLPIQGVGGADVFPWDCRGVLCRLALFSSGRVQVVDCLVFVFLGPDSAIRFSGLLGSETDDHLGFRERLKPRRR